jgi:hypothetical protein
MSTINIIPYSIEHHQALIADFEEMMQWPALEYSMLTLIQQGVTTRQEFSEAFQKMLRMSHHGGINLTHHLVQVYAYDIETGTMDTDWLMSRKGLTLIILQYPGT